MREKGTKRNKGRGGPDSAEWRSKSSMPHESVKAGSEWGQSVRQQIIAQAHARYQPV